MQSSHKFWISSQSLVKVTVLFAFIVSLVLIGAKGIGFFLTHSLALEASLLDSCLDAVMSLVNAVAVYKAYRPADCDHRFGYGKIEALSSFCQSLLTLFSALYIYKEVGMRLINPEPIVLHPVAVWVMVFATVLTSVLVTIQRYVGKKTGSTAVASDRLHYESDLFTNAAVLLSFVCSAYFTISWIDTITGFVVGSYILIMSLKMVRHSTDILIDKELALGFSESIVSIAKSHTCVLGVHDLRTRTSGHVRFIQFHLDLDASLSLKEAHDIADEVEKNIVHSHPGCEVLIHQDPIERKDLKRENFGVCNVGIF